MTMQSILHIDVDEPEKLCHCCGEYWPPTSEFFPRLPNGSLHSPCKACTDEHRRNVTDAKLWIDRCVRASIVKCAGGNCWHAATHVFWQDRAEWYPLCEDHREHGQQWSGSTNWSPSSFSLAVLPDKVDAWLSSLDPELRQKVTLEDYDATNWYALLSNESAQIHYFIGDDKRGGWRAYVRPLKAGGFCYEMEHCFGPFNFRTITGFGFFGDFPTVEACLADAREQQAKL